MENKFLNIAWSLSKDLNYLDHNDLKDFELMGYDFTEKVRNSIVNNGKVGLLYFVDQYRLFHEQFNIIDERIRKQVNVIRKMSFEPDHDDLYDVRLQNLLKFGEIWSDTWHRLNDIKSTFGPEDPTIKTDKNNHTTKYTTFSDLLTEKYKSKEQEIIKLLGKCFPDHYKEDGICYSPTRRDVKGILNSFMYELKVKKIFIGDNISSESDRLEVCKIFVDTFLPGSSISLKTLFYLDHSIHNKPDFKVKILCLKKEIEKITSIN